MERSCSDLSSRGGVKKVKEEADDGRDEDNRDFTRDSGIQWSFPNKNASLPRFMSIKTVQEVSSKDNCDSFDANHKTSVSIFQKSLNSSDHQCSTQYPVAAYSSQHINLAAAHNCHEIEGALGSNHRISVSMTNPFFKTIAHVSPASHTPVAASIVKQQLIDGAVTLSHSIVPVASSPCPPRSTSKSNPQLTIFYAGTVNIYDDISPEKAHAIMFLAGDGSPTNAKIIPNQVGSSDRPEDQFHSSVPCSGLRPPISISSNVVNHVSNGSSGNNKPISAQSTQASKVHSIQTDPRKLTPLIIPCCSALIPSAVPQARRASLTRFLEKRKERVMNRAPYDVNKKSPDSNVTHEHSGEDSTEEGSAPGNKKDHPS